MKKIEIELTRELLSMASEEFSNHTCNDVSDEFFKDWSFMDKQVFMKEFHEWQGDADDYDSENFNYIPDWLLMDFLADKLKTINT